MGKASFLDVLDSSGRIQIYVRIDDVTPEVYKNMADCWDIGDIVGIKGYVFKTRRGEISVHTNGSRLASARFTQDETARLSSAAKAIGCHMVCAADDSWSVDRMIATGFVLLVF